MDDTFETAAHEVLVVREVKDEQDLYLPFTLEHVPAAGSCSRDESWSVHRKAEGEKHRRVLRFPRSSRRRRRRRGRRQGHRERHASATAASICEHYSPDGRIDDMPYGGGAGMVVRVDVVARALEKVYGVPAREVRRGGGSYSRSRWRRLTRATSMRWLQDPT